MAAAIKAIKAGAPKDETAKKSAAPAHTDASVPPAQQNAPVSSAPPAPAHAESSVSALLARIDRWLATHRERFHRGLLPGASQADLASLRQALGGSLPDELAALLHWHAGQSSEVPGAFEQSWNLMSPAKIIAAKRERDSQPPPGWQAGWIPFLDDESGSYLVIDTAHSGHPVRASWKGNPEVQSVAPSFAAWLQDFVTALEAGKYHEDPERGRFHRAH
jgi:cell wall assembly regulator SMI1